MSNLIPIEYQGQRILTTKQLAEVYETEDVRIQQNFARNKDHFTEGKHYFMLKGEDLREFKANYLEDSNLKFVPELTLWTARGANRHCKILDTDKAWEQFDNLEENYFNPKPKQMTQAELTAAIAQNQVELERKANAAFEIATKASKQINDALHIFTTPPEKDWADSMNSIMRGICQTNNLSYVSFYGDLYTELEDLAKVNLKSRQTRLRARMAEHGATKTTCKEVSKLSVIESDAKLRPIFEGIVRKYQIKYELVGG
ncbi:MAG: ORF6N domain-containing protein [Desulfosporosinus sp.]|nr:ORF6N domain-containing protein [Desulfosporosinus sp.]